MWQGGRVLAIRDRHRLRRTSRQSSVTKILSPLSANFAVKGCVLQLAVGTLRVGNTDLHFLFFKIHSQTESYERQFR